MTKNKLIFVALPLLFIVGYLFGYTAKKPDSPIEEVQEEPSETQIIPECFLGRCPEYQSWDTDGDELAESVVLVATAMTKGAGKVLIIDEGNIVFDSGEAAQISYKIPEDNSGINITYAKEFDETGLDVKTWATDEYRYENGTYILKYKVEDEN